MRGHPLKTYRRAFLDWEPWTIYVIITWAADFGMVINYLCIWLLHSPPLV